MTYTQRRRISGERHRAARLGLHVARDGATVRHGGLLNRVPVIPTQGTRAEVTVGGHSRSAAIGLPGLMKITHNGRIYITLRSADGREIIVDRPARDETLARRFASKFNTDHAQLVSA